MVKTGGRLSTRFTTFVLKRNTGRTESAFSEFRHIKRHPNVVELDQKCIPGFLEKTQHRNK